MRGVIACECSNNAKEGGALIPTIAFGVPGSASMALLLSAFLIHDIVPGPEMLTKHLDITYALVWSVAIANILGAGICFLFANQLAKIAIIRIGVLAPLIVGVVFVGVYQSSASWGDLIALLVFGVIGWIMKRMDWPRPPVILGFVLGALFERYMYISVQRYEYDWLGFPIVIGLMALGAYGLLSPIIRNIRRERRRLGGKARIAFVRPENLGKAENVFTAIVVCVLGAAYMSARGWPLGARLVPDTVAIAGIVFAALHFAGNFTRMVPAPGVAPPPPAPKSAQDESAIDLLAGLGLRTVLWRAAVFLGWCLFYLGATRLIGLLPAMFVFLVLYMRYQGGESWRTTLSVSVGTLAFGYVLFHRLVAVSWPHSLLGDAFPVLRSIEAINLF